MNVVVVSKRVLAREWIAMYDIYENPWLLFFISLFVLVVVVMYRRLFPDKARFWQLIIPFTLMASAFGIDHFVKTDYEKIELTIKQGVASAVDNDIVLLASLVSPDFSGGRYASKKHFIVSMEEILNRANLARIKIRHNFIQIDNKTATSQMRLTVFSQPESEIGSINSMMFIELELELEKRRDNWLLNSFEIISLNDDPLS